MSATAADTVMQAMRWRYFILLALLAGPASARLYQWVDPETRHVYLSGSPPAWYRSGGKGPRVLVFDNGKLVDDTGREASEEEARALREQAAVQEQGRKEALTRPQQPETADTAAQGEAAAGEPEAATDAGGEARNQAEAAFANYLKTLVSDYFRSGALPATPAPAVPPVPPAPAR